MQKPSLYKYIKEFDNKKESKIKKKKTNVIKVEKLFNKRNDNNYTLENNTNNVIIKDLYLKQKIKNEYNNILSISIIINNINIINHFYVKELV